MNSYNYTTVTITITTSSLLHLKHSPRTMADLVRSHRLWVVEWYAPKTYRLFIDSNSICSIYGENMGILLEISNLFELNSLTNIRLLHSRYCRHIQKDAFQ